MSAYPIPVPVPCTDGTCDEAFPVTLGELLSVLSELTDDDREIVATAICMIEGGSVRLVGVDGEAW